MRDAQRNMIISIGLVILVVFIFLRNGWSTFIPSVSVPVSIIATFGAMYLLGYTLDNLSLMALTIATGFVVDDAIVVIENITRHIEDGMKPMQAALKGAEEIGFTVLSMSISLIAVFIPDSDDERHRRPSVPGIRHRSLGGDRHLDGRFAHRDADDVRAGCSRSTARHGGLYNWSEKFFQWIISTYGAALDSRAEASRVRVVRRCCSRSASTSISTSKFPRDSSRSRIPAVCRARSSGEQHISYQALVEKAKWFEEQVRTDPDVETVDAWSAGNGGGGVGGNSAKIIVQLKRRAYARPRRIR